MQTVLDHNNLEEKKVIDFLEILNQELEKISFVKTESFVLLPGKVSYFDQLNREFKLYDYKLFNTIMAKTYYEVIISPKIQLNNLYWSLKFCMDNIYSKSEYGFYENIFTTYHVLSWFLKALRLSDNKGSFDINEIMNHIPFPFLNKEADSDKNINFIVDFINLLRKFDLVEIINLKMIFKKKYIENLNLLKNLSFEPLVFGGDLNSSKIRIITENIDPMILKDINIPESYKFNYLLSFSTNYVTYDNCTNNLLLD